MAKDYNFSNLAICWLRSWLSL